MSTTDHHHHGVTTPKKYRTHTRPRAPVITLDQPGRLRVGHLLAILGISCTTLYDGVTPKPGQTTTRYPKPDGYDGRFPYWNTRTVREFLDA